MKRVMLLMLSLIMLASVLLPARSLADAPLYTLSANCGDVSCLSNTNVRDYWRPLAADSAITVTITDGRSPESLLVAFFSSHTVYTVSAYDSFGVLIANYFSDGVVPTYCRTFPLIKNTAKIVIAVPAVTEEKYGISYIAVSDKENSDPLYKNWQYDSGEGVDLLLVPTHQDDEHIFLGGVLPYFMNRGYSVFVAFSVSCGRRRVEEALNGLYVGGMRTMPDFLDYPDKRTKSIEDTITYWDVSEEAILTRFVRLIRLRKPKVIVTHDRNGENHHNEHKTTAYMLKKAFTYAADPSFDPESAATLGTWQAKKLYLHLYNKSIIKLDYSKPLERFGGRTPLQVSALCYAEHVSQHDFYKVTQGGNYDNSLYGLCLSSVGYDNIDMFYNVFGTDFKTYPVSLPTQGTAIEPAEGALPTGSPLPSPTPEITAAPVINQNITLSEPLQKLTTADSFISTVLLFCVLLAMCLLYFVKLALMHK